MTDLTPERAAGFAKMKEVYGWDITTAEGTFMEMTVDHLFAQVWTQGDLTVKERRLLLIGMAVGSGMEDVATLQLDAAMRIGEMTPEDLRTIVVFLAHYAGWPHAAKLNSEVETLIARAAKAAAQADGD